jgi:hypothetical protein
MLHKVNTKLNLISSPKNLLVLSETPIYALLFELLPVYPLSVNGDKQICSLLEEHPFLLPNLRAKNWKIVIAEIKGFIPYILNVSIIFKPSIEPCWFTDPSQYMPFLHKSVNQEQVPTHFEILSCGQQLKLSRSR